MDDSVQIPRKQCHKCDNFYPATKEFFVTGKGHKDGLRYLCKECRSLTRKDRKNPPVPKGHKRCSRCKQILPANQDFFGLRSRSKDRLYEYCRRCDKEMDAIKRATPAPDVRPDFIVCKACEIEKPFTEEFFYRNSTATYKLSYVCQDCQNERGKQYRDAHKQQTALRMQNYHRTHRAHFRKTQNAWRAANRIRVRELEKQRRLADPDQFRAKRQRYSQTEHGKAQIKAYSRIRKARKKGIGGRYSAYDVGRQYEAQKGRCYWCKKTFANGKNAYHVDHIVPITRKGSSNDPWNLVLACPSCNQSRGNKLPHEWARHGFLL